jgi:hypothetical protein
MPSTARRPVQGSATARLDGGPYDGCIVDVRPGAYAIPSEDIYVRDFDGAPVALDDFVLHGDWEQIGTLVADGWVRYYRVVGVTPPAGRPWPFRHWDRTG